MNKAKVYIDPRTTIEYASFYIAGLYNVFGRKNVIFSKKPFGSLRGFEHFLALIIKEDNIIKRIVIDFTDSKKIDKQALQWCDVYGKINITDSDLNRSNKLLPIGPSFGIKIYSTGETLFYAAFNFIKSYKYLDRKKYFLSSYKAQLKRPRLSLYTKGKTESNYIFFLSSLWKKEIETNQLRANYITSCKSIGQINFEGGFVPRRNDDIPGYEPHTTKGRISTEAYIEKLKRSMLAFNTPAVKGCHGWKLAEYLSLGKAIISTPLSRAMPTPIGKGSYMVTTDGSVEGLTKKIEQLINQPNSLTQLEQQARGYYNRYLEPSAVIKRLVRFNTLIKE